METVIPVDRISVYATGLDHPECLAFDRNGELYAGGEAGQVYRVAVGGGAAVQLCALGGFTGGIAITPDDGELLVCNPQYGLLMVGKDGAHRVFATHAGGRKLVCPNYPVFASDGSVYVTDSGTWKKNNGVLCRFTSDGRGEVVSGEMGYLNGLALRAGAVGPHPGPLPEYRERGKSKEEGERRTSNIEHPTPNEERGTLYMVESDTNSVYRVRLSGNGGVEGVEVFARHVGRLPDGLALDAGGSVYVSCYASDDVHRFSADGGTREVLAHDPFAIVLSRPTNMAFGGEGFEELYFANLGRTTISRVKVGVKGQLLANQRGG